MPNHSAPSARTVETCCPDAPGTFIETREFRRFAEFCDACRRYRYIGLCYGPPGVGKTLGARRYTDWEPIEALPPLLREAPLEAIQAQLQACTVLYTAPAVNSPGMVEREIGALRHRLHDLVLEPLRREEQDAFELSRQQELQRQKERNALLWKHDWFSATPVPDVPRIGPSHQELSQEFEQRRRCLPDPTTLVVIDEADRLRMATLEVARAIFDRGNIGLVLIGMPGMEKRLARYPQFYSRVGFVHAFRALGTAEVRALLREGWSPPGVCLPPLDDEAVTAIIRMTGGNFRLLDRLLSQSERIVQLNSLSCVTRQAVEAARESLVIGQS